MNNTSLILTSILYALFGLLFSLVFQLIIYGICKRLKNNPQKNMVYIGFKSLGIYPFLWINGIAIYNAYKLIKMPFPSISLEDKRKVFVILAIVTISYILIKAVAEYLDSNPKFAGKFQTTGVFINSIKIITLIIVLLILFNIFGIPIGPIITALGVGGALIALTLQETFANFLSGFYIASSNQIKPGDFVKISGTPVITGTVSDITWRYTIIKDAYGSYNTIPNSVLAKNTVTNFSQPNNNVFFEVKVKVSHNNNLELVENIMSEVAEYCIENYTFAIKGNEVNVRCRSIDINNVELYIFLLVKGYQNQFAMRDMFYKTLFAEFKKNKIEYPRINYNVNFAKDADAKRLQ